MSKRIILPGAVRAIREAKAASDPTFRIGQFAPRVLISTSHLCNIEAGRKHATQAVIERLAEQLGVPLDAISYELQLEAVS